MIEIYEKGSVFYYWEETVINLFFARPERGLKNINRTYCRLDFLSDPSFEAEVIGEIRANNDEGYNCYQRLNTINHSFRGRAASDEDIFAVEYLLIDIDRRGEKRSPADKNELKEARFLAGEIVKFLAAQDWPPPTIVMSGNGYHLYYAIDDVDIEPSTKNKSLRRAVVRCLASVFDSANYYLDQNVYNESRLVKIIGTTAYKGESTALRPYRQVRLVSRCSNSRFVTNEMMRNLIMWLGFDLRAEIKSLSGSAENIEKEPETPRRVARVLDALSYIDADCHYDNWCRIIWALLSTDWSCAEKLAREWSKSAPHRFDETVFSLKVNSYNPNHKNRIGLGTLFHLARAGGWNG